MKYLVCTFAFVWLGVVSYQYVNPTSREDRAILEHLSAQQIQSISIEPARAGYPTAIKYPIAIDDQQMIGVFSKAMSGMPIHHPEHPRVTHAVTLRIKLRNRVIGGYLEESDNDGTTFYCMSDVTAGWVFGTYTVSDGGKLFELIGQLAAARHDSE
ncbi:hypothetical protein [Dyella acidiphila]|uniref:Uncharacterized protein n=1 Tax=Dyella acidiphila TaxID=2775866 RepID=A0ABR9GFP5_9GAMM|nr:hypothetical protein [Dyella acidiphila]MBE1162882.1 hypothetical protein [Dyella acidiphila]